jgi:hypothetical protein
MLEMIGGATMRRTTIVLTVIVWCVLSGVKSAWAGANVGAQVSVSASQVQGDTTACTISLSSAVKTRVIDLMFRLPEGLEFLSWESGGFFDNPLTIGPTFHEPTRRLLVALAVRGRHPVTDSSGEVGTLTFRRTGADSATVNLVEAILVDHQHCKDSLISPGSPLKLAPRVEPGEPFPIRFALHTPRPNPVGPRTVVAFDIPQPGTDVEIKIYNVRGRLVRTLVDERRVPGYYSEPWDLKNDAGRSIAPGVYFCRMEAGDFKDTKKLVLLR